MHLRAAVAILLVITGALRAESRFAFTDHENRIVFIGNGFIEQERNFAYIEARLMRHSLDRAIICRNLGWSGDSVFGDARPAGYENPAGVGRLLKNTAALRPTAIFVGYGFVESFDGAAGIERFIKGYDALLDELSKITPAIVLLSPAIQEEDSQRNSDLEKYTAAVEQIAERRKLVYVDLFHPLADYGRAHPAVRLTSNGVTPSDCGYWIVAQEIERQLGIDASPWSISVTPGAGIVSAGEIEVTPMSRGNALEFEMTERCLPAPAPTYAPGATGGRIRVDNLKAGQWTLRVDGEEIVSASAGEWSRGVEVALKSDTDAAEKLRQAIIYSNQTFYRRSRPFNDHPRHFSYIDKDYPLYDAELAGQDQTITAMRKPMTHMFQIVRKGAGK